MCVGRPVFASLLAVLLLITSVAPVAANTLRWASTTDPETLDPHAVNSASVLGFLNNIYEGLVRRDRQMKIEGALATEWQALGEDGWRFSLRRDVTFHDGAAFDAEDVLFSYQRAAAEDSDVRAWFASIREVKVVDDHTIDFLTKTPNPLFPDSIANFMILDRDWAEANNSLQPSRETENHATLNANGTGAFRVTERQPGVKTVLQPFAEWWGDSQHNIEQAVYTPITNQATSVAALLSGEIDFLQPVPLQDIERVATTAGFKAVRGVEARVIMLGFGHSHDQLIDASVPTNPFKDVRVRRAAYQAIDTQSLIDKIMRGNAQAAGLLVSGAMKGYSAEHDQRLPHDLAAAKTALAEAGYNDGFSFNLSCPNDRYINDESVCKAITAMLAKVGLDAGLRAMPVRSYWPELRSGNFDMYLLGWSPGTFDAEHPLRFLLATPNKEKKLGSWNFGGFSNARIDELLNPIQTELDNGKRQAMLDQTHQVLRDEVAYVPLYVQPLAWGMKDNIDLTQRPDNFLILRWVTIN